MTEHALPAGVSDLSGIALDNDLQGAWVCNTSGVVFKLGNFPVSVPGTHAAALASVVVDSTVQEKAVAHPTDSKLLETARAKLVSAAQDAGIELKQTFAREGRLLRFKAGRYAHARQFKRMRRAIKRQSTVVGRLVREIERKASVLSNAVRQTERISSPN